MNSLADAIKNAATAPIRAIGDAAGGMIDKAKQFFHIGSPSRVFHEIGSNINEGMAQGLDSSTILATNAATRSARAVTGAYSPSLSASPLISRAGSALAGASGVTTINLNLTGGLGSGLQLLNPTDRRRFAMQIAAELGIRNNLQTNIGSGYTGN